MTIETMTKLATVTVGVGGASSIDFTNIPQTYTDLVVKFSTRNGTTASYGYLRFNSDSNSNYSYRYLLGSGSAASSSSATTTVIALYGVNDSGYTASTFGNGEIYIPNYTSSNYKSISIDGVTENNATAGYAGLVAGLWSNTAAITSVNLLPYSGNFPQYSSATLYGVKAMRTAVGNSIKATGGAISFDGTYVIHTFGATDTFTPTVPLTVDYLVVAGGGSGGAGIGGVGGAGGGGAGGFRTSIGGSALSLTAQSYAVTVGAGGAGPASGNSGSNGSNSVFSTITSTGGGKGGSSTSVVKTDGSSGGSGGGGQPVGGGATASGGAGNSGSYSPVEGYAGGNGTSSSPYGGGGGGGAGAVGTNAGVSATGAGGNGATSTISGTSVTYAGGGGAGTYPASGQTTGGTAGTGGGGSGSGSTSVAGSNGTAGTGGGGGGGASQASNGQSGSNGGNGGSGLVILRYKA